MRQKTALLLVWALTWSITLGLGLQQDHNDKRQRELAFIIDNEHDEQFHESLFPFTVRDWLGFGCTVAGLMLAAGGGIGGGGIIVPIYILIMDIPVKHAIPLASVTVLGGAVANNLLNSRKSHPDHPGRSCIDWDLLLQLEPMTMFGALMGADLNDFLPEIVLVIMLLLLLSLTAAKTLSKAHALYQQETAQMLAATNHGAAQEELTLLHADNKNLYGEDESTEEAQGNGNLDKTTVNGEVVLLSSRAKQIRAVQDVSKLIGLFVVVTFINLLKGGPESGGGPVGLDTCDETCFWISECTIMLVIALFAWHVRQTMLTRIAQGTVQSDICWDEQNTLQYPCYAIVAGLAAGLFGIGGGIVKGPLMLALGVHPQVASATSACMILFTSATATVSYAVFGNLLYDYAAACFGLGFVATAAGQTVMAVLLDHQRHSYIAYCIGIVVALSAVCMTIESVLALMSSR